MFVEWLVLAPLPGQQLYSLIWEIVQEHRVLVTKGHFPGTPRRDLEGSGKGSPTNR
jgi:hypothetical protein